MRQIVDSFAEYERAIIRARTRAALAVKKTRNERIGGIPFGAQLARDGVTLEPNPAELVIVARMRELRAAGLTLRAIAAALNREGFTTRTGAAWQHQYIAAALKSAGAAGLAAAA